MICLLGLALAQERLARTEERLVLADQSYFQPLANRLLKGSGKIGILRNNCTELKVTQWIETVEMQKAFSLPHGLFFSEAPVGKKIAFAGLQVLSPVNAKLAIGEVDVGQAVSEEDVRSVVVVQFGPLDISSCNSMVVINNGDVILNCQAQDESRSRDIYYLISNGTYSKLLQLDSVKTLSKKVSLVYQRQVVYILELAKTALAGPGSLLVLFYNSTARLLVDKGREEGIFDIAVSGRTLAKLFDRQAAVGRFTGIFSEQYRVEASNYTRIGIGLNDNLVLAGTTSAKFGSQFFQFDQELVDLKTNSIFAAFITVNNAYLLPYSFTQPQLLSIDHQAEVFLFPYSHYLRLSSQFNQLYRLQIPGYTVSSIQSCSFELSIEGSPAMQHQVSVTKSADSQAIELQVQKATVTLSGNSARLLPVSQIAIGNQLRLEIADHRVKAQQLTQRELDLEPLSIDGKVEQQFYPVANRSFFRLTVNGSQELHNSSIEVQTCSFDTLGCSSVIKFSANFKPALTDIDFQFGQFMVFTQSNAPNIVNVQRTNNIFNDQVAIFLDNSTDSLPDGALIIRDLVILSRDGSLFCFLLDYAPGQFASAKRLWQFPLEVKRLRKSIIHQFLVAAQTSNSITIYRVFESGPFQELIIPNTGPILDFFLSKLSVIIVRRDKVQVFMLADGSLKRVLNFDGTIQKISFSQTNDKLFLYLADRVMQVSVEVPSSQAFINQFQFSATSIAAVGLIDSWLCVIQRDIYKTYLVFSAPILMINPVLNAEKAFKQQFSTVLQVSNKKRSVSLPAVFQIINNVPWVSFTDQHPSSIWPPSRSLSVFDLDDKAWVNGTSYQYLLSCRNCQLQNYHLRQHFTPQKELRVDQLFASKDQLWFVNESKLFRLDKTGYLSEGSSLEQSLVCTSGVQSRQRLLVGCYNQTEQTVAVVAGGIAEYYRLAARARKIQETDYIFVVGEDQLTYVYSQNFTLFTVLTDVIDLHPFEGHFLSLSKRGLSIQYYEQLDGQFNIYSRKNYFFADVQQLNQVVPNEAACTQMQLLHLNQTGQADILISCQGSPHLRLTLELAELNSELTIAAIKLADFFLPYGNYPVLHAFPYACPNSNRIGLAATYLRPGSLLGLHWDCDRQGNTLIAPHSGVSLDSGLLIPFNNFFFGKQGSSFLNFSYSPTIRLTVKGVLSSLLFDSLTVTAINDLLSSGFQLIIIYPNPVPPPPPPPPPTPSKIPVWAIVLIIFGVLLMVALVVLLLKKCKRRQDEPLFNSQLTQQL